MFSCSVAYINLELLTLHSILFYTRVLASSVDLLPIIFHSIILFSALYLDISFTGLKYLNPFFSVLCPVVITAILYLVALIFVCSCIVQFTYKIFFGLKLARVFRTSTLVC